MILAVDQYEKANGRMRELLAWPPSLMPCLVAL
jgi:hypothetical protein